MNGYSFTERVRKVLAMAREEAARLHHDYVGTEHILLGLIREGEGVAMGVLANLNVDPDVLARDVEEAVRPSAAAQSTGPDLPYTSRAKKVLELAMSESRELDHSYVGTEHLLLGLLREEKGIAAQVLVRHDATIDRVRAEALRLLGREPAAAASGARAAPLSLGGGAAGVHPLTTAPGSPCPKCGGAMREGFVLSDTQGGYGKPEQWIGGPPEPSFWTGTKTRGRPRHAITTYRCERCGYLEAYAR